MKLTIATCQFPTGNDIAGNLRYVLRQMRHAKEAGAHIAHFAETCLSGYAGFEVKSSRDYDWSAIDAAMQRVADESRTLGLWVIVGSAHRLTGSHKPHNSLYIINGRGKLIDRYDKMFCTGSDLQQYSPGSHMPVFTIRGVRCGVQICHDMRYQELYREYKRKNIELMFHSYYNGRMSKTRVKQQREYIGHISLNGSDNIWGVIVPPTMQTYAANNYFYISANNTSNGSSWPSFFVRPDGVITGKLRRSVAGVLVSKIDTSVKFYDASTFRNTAMKGTLHSGKLVRDRRTNARTTL
jgi:predicted amidohydrolase